VANVGDSLRRLCSLQHRIYNLLDYITYLKRVKIKLSHDKEIVATPMPETRKAAQNVENAWFAIFILHHIGVYKIS